MAPALIDASISTPGRPHKPAPVAIYPDGIKTSGQHPPLYDELSPFKDFPEEITSPTVWKAENYVHAPEQWIHRFTEEEIAELSDAADAFLASDAPLTGITKHNFELPRLSGFLTAVRSELLNGKGFILFKGFPVESWGNHKSAVAYMGLGTYLGYFVSQNSRGHVLGHVKDVGDDAKQIDKGPNGPREVLQLIQSRQFFHTDYSDIVGLLCVARALTGGESDIVSAHHVYNVLRRERPDVLEALAKPIWYFDRKGEVSDGEEPYIRSAVFFLERGAEGRVYTRYDPYFIRSLTRFSDAGLIPPLSPAQLEAADVLEETCRRLSLHMILEVGDIQFLSNEHVFHARTAYTDHAPPAPRRHLMRLWLATPEDEGGWRLPYHDSAEKKRGGVQVNDQPPVAPLDAE